MKTVDCKMTWRQFFGLLKSVISSKWLLVTAIMMEVFSSGSNLLIPLVTRNIVDDFSTDMINMTNISVIAVLFLAKTVFSGLSIFQLNYLGQQITENIRLKLWKKIIFLPVSYFDEKEAGKMVSQMTNDTTQVKNVITSHIITIISSGLSVIGAVCVLLVLDAKLTVFILVCALIMILTVVPFSNRMYQISKQNQEKNAELTSIVGQTLSEIRLVKSSNAESKEVSRVEKIVHELTRLGVRSGKVQAIMTPLLSLISMVILVLIVGFGGIRVASGQLSTGNLVAFILYVFQILSPMMQLFSTVTQIHVVKGSSERIMLTLNEEIENILEGLPVNNGDFDMSFKNVSFSYDGNRRQLSNISFEIPQNSFTAIVGPSGAGKTTLFSLIERYYRPQSGNIYLNNQPLDSYSIQSWRENIGYVSQEVPLINGSIRDNITYGTNGIVNDRVLNEVAQKSSLLDFIESLPAGYDTYVGDRGIKLSGGQRQRIGIARAILRDPRLLLLDEATSNLDSISERKIQSAFANVMQGRTTAVIAHRLSTIQKADQIIFLEEGAITGIGTHKQLLERHSLYRKYIEYQYPNYGLENAV